MVAVTKITAKGQITLPKEVRRFLKVEAGSVIIFEKEADRVFLRPSKTLLEYRGYLKGRKKSVDFDQMRKTAKEHVGGKGIRGRR